MVFGYGVFHLGRPVICVRMIFQVIFTSSWWGMSKIFIGIVAGKSRRIVFKYSRKCRWPGNQPDLKPRVLAQVVGCIYSPFCGGLQSTACPAVPFLFQSYPGGCLEVLQAVLVLWSMVMRRQAHNGHENPGACWPLRWGTVNSPVWWCQLLSCKWKGRKESCKGPLSFSIWIFPKALNDGRVESTLSHVSWWNPVRSTNFA